MPAIGSARRIQALYLAGWREKDMQDGYGFRRCWEIANNPNGFVMVRNHRAIRELSRKLHGKQGPSETTRTRARKRGWVPLAAWDNIDDPNELPDLGEQPARDAWLEDIADLAAAGVTLEEAARRVGRAVGTVEGKLLGRGKRELLEALIANGPGRTPRKGRRIIV